MFDNRIALYIAEAAPSQTWRDLAEQHNWHLLHQADLMSALGAYITYLPAIVVLDLQDSPLAREASYHLESVFTTSPQNAQLVIELRHCYQMTQQGLLMRISIPKDASMSQLNAMLDEACQLAAPSWKQPIA